MIMKCAVEGAGLATGGGVAAGGLGGVQCDIPAKVEPRPPFLLDQAGWSIVLLTITTTAVPAADMEPGADTRARADTGAGPDGGAAAGVRWPATDLGFLLHKNPARVQAFEVSAGTAHVFYPEATPQRCTAALLLEVDPVALVRGRRGPDGGEG